MFVKLKNSLYVNINHIVTVTIDRQTEPNAIIVIIDTVKTTAEQDTSISLRFDSEGEAAMLLSKILK